MIKGVNRQIIEISDTGNIYFERALLIVRPDFTEMSRELLNREARDIVKGAGGYTGLKLAHGRIRLRRVVQCAAAGAAGLIAGAAAMLILR